MTQEVMPGTQNGPTIPTGVNTSEAVVGWDGDAYGDRWGFSISVDLRHYRSPDRIHVCPGQWHQRFDDDRRRFPIRRWPIPRLHLFGGEYTTYDEDTTESCRSSGINAGDFVGDDGDAGGHIGRFIYIGANPPIEFYGSGTDTTYAYGINNADEVVGEYFDSSNDSTAFIAAPAEPH